MKEDIFQVLDKLLSEFISVSTECEDEGELIHPCKKITSKFRVSLRPTTNNLSHE